MIQLADVEDRLDFAIRALASADTAIRWQGWPRTRTSMPKQPGFPRPVLALQLTTTTV
jgi:hypothetical protein